MRKLKEFKIIKTESKKFLLLQNQTQYVVEGKLGSTSVSFENLYVKRLEDGIATSNTKSYYFTSVKDQQTFLTNLKLNILGVLCGFGKELIIKGIGYKVWKVKNKLYFKLGYSHWLEYEIPNTLIVRGKKNRLVVFGSKKEQVGLVAELLRSIKEPDAYKGKGIQYVDENLKLKVGKQRQR